MAYPQDSQRPLSSTSVTEWMRVARAPRAAEAVVRRRDFGVIATRTSSRQEISPHVVQRKCG